MPHSPNLRYEPLSPDDAQEFSGLADPALWTYVMPLTAAGWPPGIADMAHSMLNPPPTGEEVTQWIEAISAHSGGRAWSIRSGDSRAVGIAVDRPGGQSAEIELIVVLRPEWGRGYGAEILTALRDGLEGEGATEIRAQIRSTNKWAQAAAERAGFVYSGVTTGQGMERWVFRSCAVPP